ncbi:MAG: serpin family protein [Bacteroidales bacterium]|nr:serpin family protein [Bacteroidales bacterium]
MKNNIIIIAILMLVFAYACEKTEDAPVQEIKLTKSTRDLIKADNEFGLELFTNVVNSFPEDENVFISPVSAALALAMTYNGAAGTTKEAMEAALKKSGMETAAINQSYQDLMDGLKSIDPKVTLDIANSIWYRQGFYVTPGFLETNQDYYDAEVRPLDFGNPSAIETINNWVSDKTNDKINEIIKVIPPYAIMYLINAVYFYGTWKYEFKAEDTSEEDFYVSGNQSVRVDMMKLEAGINYMYNDTFSAIELPYGNGHYSMIVMLPGNQHTTTDIIARLTTDNWATWMGSFSQREIVVNLPKFKFEFEDSLNNALKNMGMSVAFSPSEADFTNINPEGNLYISMVKQKAYIDVNEKGTEAAAVTVVEVGYTSAGDGKTHFVVNKPFLFAIVEKDTGSIIFIGRVAQPEYEE